MSSDETLGETARGIGVTRPQQSFDRDCVALLSEHAARIVLAMLLSQRKSFARCPSQRCTGASQELDLARHADLTIYLSVGSFVIALMGLLHRRR